MPRREDKIGRPAHREVSKQGTSACPLASGSHQQFLLDWAMRGSGCWRLWNAMKTVAFDESGHSGENLLDAEQPIYSLASVCLANDTAEALVSELLAGRQAGELKFKDLRRRSGGRRLVLQVLRSRAVPAGRRRISVAQKSWFLCAKIVDLLLEPVATSSGAFYASGLHRDLATYLHAHAGTDLPIEVWRDFQEVFVRAVRSGEQGPLHELCERLRAVKSASQDTLTGKIFSAVPVSIQYLEGEVRGEKARDQLEPSVTSLVQQLQAWSEHLAEPFRVVHDDSNVVRAWVQDLLALSNSTIDPIEVTSDVATFRLPLQRFTVEFSTSESNASVQLADIFAGAAAWWLRDRVAREGCDRFAGEIQAAGLRADWAVGSPHFHTISMSPPS